MTRGIVAALCTTQSFNPRADLPMSTSSPHGHPGAHARKKAAPSLPICPLGTEASLNKCPIIHPGLNNRHSRRTIVSFPCKSPRPSGLKIDASITYVHTHPRCYNYSLRLDRYMRTRRISTHIFIVSIISRVNREKERCGVIATRNT